MERDCEIVLEGIPENVLKTKRKSRFPKKYFCCESSYFSKKRKSNVNDTYPKYSHLSNSNCIKFDATAPTLTKPCVVELSALDSKLRTAVETSKMKNTSNLRSFKRGKQKLVKSLGTRKKIKSKSSASDLKKILKPCSVNLEESNFNYFSKLLEINFPLPFCSTGWVKLKPCSVILQRINTNEAKISMLDVAKDIQPCNVKLQENTSEVISVMHKELDKKETSFEKIIKLKTDSQSLDLNLSFKEEKPSSQSDYVEIYPDKNITTNIFNQFENIDMEEVSQSLLACSLVNNGTIKVTEACDTHPNELNSSLGDEKFSVISECGNFAKAKHPGSESSASYTDKMSESRCKSLSILNSEKVAGSSKGFEILKDSDLRHVKFVDIQKKMGNKSAASDSNKILKPCAVILKKSSSDSDSIKNDPSSLELTVKSYSRSNEDCGLQCQTPENVMYHCFHCSKSLPSLKSFYYHLCREKQKRGYPCKFCGKNFDFYWALKKHKKCHALRNSLSCSDTMKSRQRKRKIEKSNGLLGLENNVDIKVFNSHSKTIGERMDNNVESGPGEKENGSFSKLKPKKLRTKFFLQSISDATTSSGCYSSRDSNFSGYIWNSDDSDADQ